MTTRRTQLVEALATLFGTPDPRPAREVGLEFLAAEPLDARQKQTIITDALRLRIATVTGGRRPARLGRSETMRQHVNGCRREVRS